jgi:uncharacterized OB-fold protein
VSVGIGPLPLLNEENTPFWTGGADGKLMIPRCQACKYWIHPPSPLCPICRSWDVVSEAVSGRGEVFSYTISRVAWFPGLTAPYALVVVALPEQDGLRLTTRMVNCDPEDVKIGMAVTVTFEQAADIWRPLFQPAGAVS